ncbi:MAG: polyphosphate kinase 2 family protein [Armatimonadetes bacterium]|nr:polyphosphate kinase 2 family protein [Armatimonadota bacterium]
MSYAYKVKPGDKVRLSSFDPKEHAGLSKDKAKDLTEDLGTEMASLQELLFAAGQTSLLIVLQGLDTSGKDGAIRSILTYANVQSCRVIPFKVPTSEELAHDFLWRVHRETPRSGAVSIFNRSHYEDVLIVRVHNLVPKQTWEQRYQQINQFEQLLISSGVLILKFFLHISKEEQRERLLEREKDPTKAWKLAVADWKEREHWDSYMDAYEDALTRCTTREAPWHIVPSDHKWFRNLAITQCIVESLRPFKDEWMKHLEKMGVEAKKELQKYRNGETGN